MLHDDLANADPARDLAKVETVKVVMQDSIELALQNQRLEAIDQSGRAPVPGGMFKSRAHTQKADVVVRQDATLIAFIILVIIVAIARHPRHGQFDKKKGKGKDKKKKDVRSSASRPWSYGIRVYCVPPAPHSLYSLGPSTSWRLLGPSRLANPRINPGRKDASGLKTLASEQAKISLRLQ